MSSEIAIKVENLSKCYHIYDQPRDRLKQFVLPRLQCAVGMQSEQYYREFWALKNVSFEVKKGETVGIIGRNGSGKSTLLQMICGTLNPTSGNIQTQGRIAALLELGSGFNPEFTGRENVSLNGAVLGLNKDEIDARFEDIAAFADIGSFIEQPVKTYSSGMMIRLAFAVIAHVDASILIVDEALSVGDAFFTQKCMRFIRHFQNEGGTLLFVSHDTASVCSLCGSAIWLDKGRIFQRGTPKEISEQYLEATLGNVQRERAPENTTANRPVAPQEIVDQRQQYINSTNLRNDLKVFDFDPNAPSFGNGGALITNVEFLDETGKKLSWIVGGEEVVLKVDAKIERPLASPIIGFYVRDRLGQTLFGDNTYLSYINNPLASNAGDCLQATFRFQMPRLPVGNYSISVAIADGNQAEHIQHHWIHDSLMFSSQSTSVASGVVGIPMRHIDLEKVQKDEKHG